MSGCFLLLAAAQAPDSDGAVVIGYDLAGLRLSIGTHGDAPTVRYRIERRIGVETLMATIPNHNGETQYRGRLTQWEQLRWRLGGTADLAPRKGTIEVTETVETTLAFEVDPARDTRTTRTMKVDGIADLWPRDPARYAAQGRIKPRR